MKIKKNDMVTISSGKDKGKKGKVLRSFPKQGTVIVEGINLAKKRQKAKKTGQKGQTMAFALPVKSSSVKIFCVSCSAGVRVGYKMVGDKKVRICKKCGREV